MAYYTATIAIDRGARNDRDGRQIVVHWDDNDPNRFIYAPISVDHPLTGEAELVELLAGQGWRVVSDGSDNVGRGWAIVTRKDKRLPFYNPLSRSWQAFLSDDEKRAVREKYPDATVPGTWTPSGV